MKIVSILLVLILKILYIDIDEIDLLTSRIFGILILQVQQLMPCIFKRLKVLFLEECEHSVQLSLCSAWLNRIKYIDLV